MLITQDIFLTMVLAAFILVFGPVVGGIVWIRRHAIWYRSLNGIRQLAIPLALVAWMFLLGVTLLNYRAWIDVADVWVIRDRLNGIAKEDMTLMGSATYSFAEGKQVKIVADKAHYWMIINDSSRHLRKMTHLYGTCTSASPYTLGTILGLEPDFEIPPGTVSDNPPGGQFGSGSRPPEKITIQLSRPDYFPRCESLNWYFPVEGKKP